MYSDNFFESCGKGRIRYRRWEPIGEIRGIVQLVHGIAEHIERYNGFAGFLNEHGFLVVAEDHMGHGLSIGTDGIKGYFHGGWFSAVEDSYRLLRQLRQEFPDMPYILFGHSMGSFMARTILEKYPDSGIRGCAICGTAWMPELALSAGSSICNAICQIADETKPSQLLQSLIFGGYNKKVEHPRTPFDWLSRDTQIVDGYIADPMCGFSISAGLARDMLMGIRYIQRKENLFKMDSTLPILFISGGDDPVGDYGNGVRKAASMFKRVGMVSVKIKTYPLCRHEILNEINRLEVYEDVLRWIEAILN